MTTTDDTAVRFVLDPDVSDGGSDRYARRYYDVFRGETRIGSVQKGSGVGMTYQPWVAYSAVKRNPSDPNRAAKGYFESRKLAGEWLVRAAKVEG